MIFGGIGLIVESRERGVCAAASKELGREIKERISETNGLAPCWALGMTKVVVHAEDKQSDGQLRDGGLPYSALFART